MHPSQILDWESLTQLVSSASLEDFGLKHEIDELVKLRDTNLVMVIHSSLRSGVTAPVFVAGEKAELFSSWFLRNTCLC